MTDTRKLFGVLIYCDDGRKFLAHSACDSPNLFFKRRLATAYQLELRQHDFKKTKVVPVTMRLTYPTPEFKKARAART